MANIKVSEMTEASSFDDGDYTMIVQANQNKKISKENMIGKIENNIGDLTNLETEDKTNLVNATNEIVNGKEYIEQPFTNVSCTQNTNNNLTSFNLTAGIWIVVGYFFYQSSDLRYYLTLTSNDIQEITTSAYDNSGNVAGHVCGIINVESTSNIVFKLWPTAKNVSVSGYLRAVKYQ